MYFLRGIAFLVLEYAGFFQFWSLFWNLFGHVLSKMTKIATKKKTRLRGLKIFVLLGTYNVTMLQFDRFFIFQNKNKKMKSRML